MTDTLPHHLQDSHGRFTEFSRRETETWSSEEWTSAMDQRDGERDYVTKTRSDVTLVFSQGYGPTNGLRTRS